MPSSRQPADREKFRSISLLVVAEVAAMSLWFVSAAILPDMVATHAISEFRQAALSSGVQAGFVAGSLVSAVLGIPDRYDPRRVFAASALSAGILNGMLLIAEPGGLTAISIRFSTGALLAGVYPVGMKIAVGWGDRDRGFLVGTLVGALTLGTASPHLVAFGGGSDWRITIGVTSAAAILSALLCLLVRLGPHHGTAPSFDVRAIATAWTNRRVRLAYAGYFGHMWELFAMWAWIGVASAASYSAWMDREQAEELGKLTAFCAIASGSVFCALAGYFADRIGKAEVTIIAMGASGTCALAMALSFGGPVWLVFAIAILWGIAIIPDSAQFSALVADASPAHQAGSLMTLQTSIGFLLTFFTVQITPVAAAALGWPLVLASLALGPIFGILAMARLRAMGPA